MQPLDERKDFEWPPALWSCSIPHISNAIMGGAKKTWATSADTILNFRYNARAEYYQPFPIFFYSGLANTWRMPPHFLGRCHAEPKSCHRSVMIPLLISPAKPCFKNIHKRDEWRSAYTEKNDALDFARPHDFMSLVIARLIRMTRRIVQEAAPDITRASGGGINFPLDTLDIISRRQKEVWRIGLVMTRLSPHLRDGRCHYVSRARRFRDDDFARRPRAHRLHVPRAACYDIEGRYFANYRRIFINTDDRI